MTAQSIKTLLKQSAAFLAVKSGFVSIKNKSGTNGRLTILMYHRVNPERDVLGLSVSPTFFDQHLSFLASRFTVISLAESVAMLSNGIPDGNYAVITFDDGYRDNYDFAFPLLRKHQLPATIFVTVNGLETGYFGWYSFDRAILDSRRESIDLTSFRLGMVDLRTRAKKEQAIFNLHQELKLCSHEKRKAACDHVVSELSENTGTDRERIMLTWDEAREMQKSGLVTIASHTMTHPILTRVDREKACDEIVRSKAIIEEKLGTVVDLFAYPNGTTADYNDEIVGMLKAAGYAAACTTAPGSAPDGADPYRLPRVDVTFGMCEGIGGRFSLEMFEWALSVPYKKR